MLIFFFHDRCHPFSTTADFITFLDCIYLSDCCAVGLFIGFHCNISSMSMTASSLAFGIKIANDVRVKFGNLKFIAAAIWYPSGQSSLSGVPITEHILNISSISLLPGNKGLNVYSSAIIQPTAQMSIGLL